MSAATAPARERTVQDSLDLLQALLGDYGPRDFAVRFWDGTCWDADPEQPTRFTLVLKHPGSLRRMFWPPRRLNFLEAYIFDDYDVEGDLESFLFVGRHLREQKRNLGQKLRMGMRLFRAPTSDHPRLQRRPAQVEGSEHSPERDRQAVSYHYDVSNDFYALWLDCNLVYSCAYFGTPDDDLDTAQVRKLDHLCRKLRLEPGDRLLDIGCGWGGLIVHAAKHYGADMLGITLSKQQLEWAQRRIQEEGLADRCRVELRDYRQVEGPFDKVVSVGMVEHVGEKMLPAYFAQAMKVLRPGGVFLNHGINLNFHEPMPREPSFVHRYVFPDGELVPISRLLHYAEAAGFEVRDLESFRDHYALTLRHWVRRLEARADEARRLTDEVTYRIYRVYLSASALGFRLGVLTHYQALLLKPANGVSGLPLTRDDWYLTPVR